MNKIVAGYKAVVIDTEKKVHRNWRDVPIYENDREDLDMLLKRVAREMTYGIFYEMRDDTCNYNNHNVFDGWILMYKREEVPTISGNTLEELKDKAFKRYQINAEVKIEQSWDVEELT